MLTSSRCPPFCVIARWCWPLVGIGAGVVVGGVLRINIEWTKESGRFSENRPRENDSRRPFNPGETFPLPSTSRYPTLTSSSRDRSQERGYDRERKDDRERGREREVEQSRLPVERPSSPPRRDGAGARDGGGVRNGGGVDVCPECKVVGHRLRSCPQRLARIRRGSPRRIVQPSSPREAELQRLEMERRARDVLADRDIRDVRDVRDVPGDSRAATRDVRHRDDRGRERDWMNGPRARELTRPEDRDVRDRSWGEGRREVVAARSRFDFDRRSSIRRSPDRSADLRDRGRKRSRSREAERPRTSVDRSGASREGDYKRRELRRTSPERSPRRIPPLRSPVRSPPRSQLSPARSTSRSPRRRSPISPVAVTRTRSPLRSPRRSRSASPGSRSPGRVISRSRSVEKSRSASGVRERAASRSRSRGRSPRSRS